MMAEESSHRIRIDAPREYRAPWRDTPALKAPFITLDDASRAVKTCVQPLLERGRAPIMVPLTMDIEAGDRIPGFVVDADDMYFFAGVRVTKNVRKNPIDACWTPRSGLIDFSVAPKEAFCMDGSLWDGLKDVPLNVCLDFARKRQFEEDRTSPTGAYVTLGALKYFYGLPFDTIIEKIPGTGFISPGKILAHCVQPDRINKLTLPDLSVGLRFYQGLPALEGTYLEPVTRMRRGFLIPKGFDTKSFVTVTGALPSKMDIQRMSRMPQRFSR